MLLTINKLTLYEGKFFVKFRLFSSNTIAELCEKSWKLIKSFVLFLFNIDTN